LDELKRKPFQNLDVRKGLEYAINRPLINKTSSTGWAPSPIVVCTVKY